MTDEIIDLVTKKHLVVVHGDSGSGKSSIVRAGVLVQLQQGHAATDAAWRTCAMLPREDALGNLARALAGLRADKPTPDQILDVRHILNRGRRAPETLTRLLRQGESDHICILVDQVEELFTLAKRRGPGDARLFVDFLVGLEENPPPGLYAILTMRSEFLGHCARFEGLAGAVNRTQYLLPRMERPALLRAIREPATLYGGEVSQELAERLIADAGGGQDQLPLIQHGLMRLWRRKAVPATGLAETAAPYQYDGISEATARFEIDEAPLSFGRDDDPAWRLGLEDYRGAGGLATLLSDHADAVLEQAAPDPSREKIVEHLFRALTDINAEGQAIRRPQTFAELVAVTGSDAPTLKAIIGHFRAKGVFFLTPFGDAPIKPGTLIDISHEALIRCWRKIADQEKGWLQREFRDGLIWKTLRMQAQRGETLSAVATEARDAWLRTLPSPAWAERYDDSWDEVERLMIASRKARDEEARQKREFEEAKRREAEERARRAEEAHRAAAEIAARQQELREAQERIAEEQRRRAEAEQQRAIEAEVHANEAEAGHRHSKRLAIIASSLALAALVAAGLASLSWWQAYRAYERAVSAEPKKKPRAVKPNSATPSSAPSRPENNSRRVCPSPPCSWRLRPYPKIQAMAPFVPGSARRRARWSRRWAHSASSRYSAAMMVRSVASRSRPRATGSFRAGTMARCGCGSWMVAPPVRHSRAMRVGS
jgi:hypothetical protein